MRCKSGTTGGCSLRILGPTLCYLFARWQVMRALKGLGSEATIKVFKKRIMWSLAVRPSVWQKHLSCRSRRGGSDVWRDALLFPVGQP